MRNKVNCIKYYETEGVPKKLDTLKRFCSLMHANSYILKGNLRRTQTNYPII